MDRFIVELNYYGDVNINNLKSNMDRFIVELNYYGDVNINNLKSNMDRFIEINFTITYIRQ